MALRVGDRVLISLTAFAGGVRALMVALDGHDDRVRCALHSRQRPLLGLSSASRIQIAGTSSTRAARRARANRGTRPPNSHRV